MCEDAGLECTTPLSRWDRHFIRSETDAMPVLWRYGVGHAGAAS